MSNTFPHNRFARRTREDAAKCVCFLMLLPFNFSVWFRFQNATEYSPEKDARLDFCQTILPALRFSSIYLFSAISFLFAWLDFLDRGGFNMSTLRLSYYFDGWHELSSALLPSFGWKLNAERQWMERSMPTDWPYLKLIATQYSIIEHLFSFFVPWRWLDSDKDKCTYSLQWEKMICTLRVEQWPKRERKKPLSAFSRWFFLSERRVHILKHFSHFHRFFGYNNGAEFVSLVNSLNFQDVQLLFREETWNRSTYYMAHTIER